ncbi:hypothetical protein EHS25_008223 [Saitozyma podzolica]|uniref:Uncharacterized protein n=1 Tax=Saitozyma podzolica TaxID=1890683 RepID=A0A427YNX4_9TREE|nr:hypothetical protein EHS25_008223 [Saitozyma podzolica]
MPPLAKTRYSFKRSGYSASPFRRAAAKELQAELSLGSSSRAEHEKRKFGPRMNPGPAGDLQFPKQDTDETSGTNDTVRVDPTRGDLQGRDGTTEAGTLVRGQALWELLTRGSSSYALPVALSVSASASASSSSTPGLISSREPISSVGSSSIHPQRVTAGPGTDAKSVSQSVASPGPTSPGASCSSKSGLPMLAIGQTSSLDIRIPSRNGSKDKSDSVKSSTGSSGPGTSDISTTRPLRTASRITSSRSSRSGKKQGTTSARAIHDRPKAHVDHKSGSDRALAEMKDRSAQAGEPAEGDIEAILREVPPHLDMDDESVEMWTDVLNGSVRPQDVVMTEVKPAREMKVDKLHPHLSRVLFRQVEDSRTGVFNFDPDLSPIPTPDKFAFHRTPQYITPSQDSELLELAKQSKTSFVGSTSTLTKSLSQVYFALSGGKGVDISSLSQGFGSERTDFTAGASLPAAIVIGPLSDGLYYVDSDKSFDSENVLSDFGRILEKRLTTETDDFNRFLRSAPESAVPQDERTEREAYRYRKVGSLLMRSQLDCHDPRLPGHGVFDIKTRACLPIRHDRANWIANSAYDISKERGLKWSYERELYDLIRAGMLKYSFQARIGDMDGIFVAYHNTARVFGFQYLPLSELDEILFGSTEMAERYFNLCVAVLEVIIKQIVAEFPKQTVSVILNQAGSGEVKAFVQPREPDTGVSGGSRPFRAISVSLENLINGEKAQSGEIDQPPGSGVGSDWTVKYTVRKNTSDTAAVSEAKREMNAARRLLLSMNVLNLPDGKTARDMKRSESHGGVKETEEEASNEEKTEKADGSRVKSEGEVDSQRQSHSHSEGEGQVQEQEGGMGRTRWKTPDRRITALRRDAQESGAAYERNKAKWRSDDQEVWWAGKRGDSYAE